MAKGWYVTKDSDFHFPSPFLTSHLLCFWSQMPVVRYFMGRPTWQGMKERKPSANSCEALRPQSKNPWGTETCLQPCEWARQWVLPTWVLSDYSPVRDPEPRTQLSYSWILSPQKLWDNRCCFYMTLRFGVIYLFFGGVIYYIAIHN